MIRQKPGRQEDRRTGAEQTGKPSEAEYRNLATDCRKKKVAMNVTQGYGKIRAWRSETTKRGLRVGANEPKKCKWYSLIDKIWATPNLEEAFKDVKRNGGAAGVDGVTIKEFEAKLEDHVQVFQQVLRTKTYRPKPVRRVYIPKADGSKRPLGIPTVGDRVMQAATRRILEPIFEAKFYECSYGFRPGRSAHMALKEIRKHLREGNRFVIDADLKSYFDTIPHERLLKEVQEEVVDGSVLQLLKLFLQAGVMEDGIVQPNETGTPQGGVISPLLANIYLHPLDELLTKRGHRIVRYADDFVICCRTQKGAKRVLQSVVDFLEGEMGLNVHPVKTRIVDTQSESFVFLGHEFIPGEWMRPSAKAMEKFKERVKEITRRNQTVDVSQLVKKKLNAYLRGWGNYFGHGDVKSKFAQLDSWIRRRLRMVQLRSWRKVRKLHREMRRRGWEREMPSIRMTAWRNSSCTYAHFALPNTWFKEIGLCNLLDIYNEHHPQRG
jgi:RNA-directed DNA polymerase